MRILLANDDGVYAPGLAALEQQLRELGEVVVVAPVTEQSGVGHSITFLTPLMAKSIQREGQHWAWAVDGSPADCVKLAIGQLYKEQPFDLVVSGVNHGMNAGINVLYSGTVAAAVEGAFFGVTSVAVSLEYDEEADFQTAAVIAKNVISGIVARPDSKGGLYNLNIPTAATRGPSDLKVVPMGLEQYGRCYEKRTDPHGREYYWALWSEPERPPPESADVIQLREGNVTLTPLRFDLTDPGRLQAMTSWDLKT